MKIEDRISYQSVPYIKPINRNPMRRIEGQGHHHHGTYILSKKDTERKLFIAFGRLMFEYEYPLVTTEFHSPLLNYFNLHNDICWRGIGFDYGLAMIDRIGRRLKPHAVIHVDACSGELENLKSAAEKSDLDVTIKDIFNGEMALFCVPLKNTFGELFDFSGLLEYYADLVVAAKLVKSKERALVVLRDKFLELENRKIDDYIQQLCFGKDYGRQERVMRIDLMSGYSIESTVAWLVKEYKVLR